GAAGMERGHLGLGNLTDLAEHLRGTCLVEADFRVGEADGVENPRDAEGCHLACQYGLAERRLHEGLRRKVVDLLRAVLAYDGDHRDLVEDVTGDQLDVILDVGDALEVEGAGSPDHAGDLVAFGEQELRQVRTVLTGDASDESTSSHLNVLLASLGLDYPGGRPALGKCCSAFGCLLRLRR